MSKLNCLSVCVCFERQKDIPSTFLKSGPRFIFYFPVLQVNLKGFFSKAEALRYTLFQSVCVNYTEIWCDETNKYMLEGRSPC